MDLRKASRARIEAGKRHRILSWWQISGFSENSFEKNAAMLTNEVFGNIDHVHSLNFEKMTKIFLKHVKNGEMNREQILARFADRSHTTQIMELEAHLMANTCHKALKKFMTQNQKAPGLDF